MYDFTMKQNHTDHDVIVIGGGINGVCIARDASGRGLSTLLLEMNDLASATSSESTKLIHGGLRYLEYYDFKLVAESLRERERMLSIAPHIVRPLQFILPHEPHLRPAWMIRIGLFLYDHLGGRTILPKSRHVQFSEHSPLQQKFTNGFVYSDSAVDDARLVVLNALDSVERGARIKTNAECIGIAEENGIWHVQYKNHKGEIITNTAPILINATGPWVRSFMDKFNLSKTDTPHIKLVRGSHIVVPRLYEDSYAYILQQQDNRIVFAIPYENDYTLIGTTEETHTDLSVKPEISNEETDYLCKAINSYFNRNITPEDIIWSYSGVRPLFDDGHASASATTRDYKIINDDHNGAQLLSIFGGKITTSRQLAEDALNLITPKNNWTRTAPLPGGDFDIRKKEEIINVMCERYNFLSAEIIQRYFTHYGTRLCDIIGKAKSIEEMGVHYGDDVYEHEVRYLIEYEWARTTEDILWRRSKLGLHIRENTKNNIQNALPALLKEFWGTT
jgi:glycerol-3-phosphate dehydrogenase